MGRKQSTYIVLYLGIAFSISAICWLVPLFISQQHNLLLPTADNFLPLLSLGFDDTVHLFLGGLFAAATFGPFIAAVIVTSLESGRAGLTNLWLRVSRWRVSLRWYATILFIALAITFIPSLVALLTGLSKAEELFVLAPLHVYLLLFVFQLFSSGLGEEVGWRGYLQPALFARDPSARSIWLTGLAWAIWHYPFVIFLFLTTLPELPASQAAIMLLLSLAGFTMTIIGQAFVYAWLLNNTQSAFLAIIYHALGNTFATLLGAGALAAGPLVLLPALAPWAVVIILEKRAGKESFYPNTAKT